MDQHFRGFVFFAAAVGSLNDMPVSISEPSRRYRTNRRSQSLVVHLRERSFLQRDDRDNCAYHEPGRNPRSRFEAEQQAERGANRW